MINPDKMEQNAFQNYNNIDDFFAEFFRLENSNPVYSNCVFDDIFVQTDNNTEERAVLNELVKLKPTTVDSSTVLKPAMESNLIVKKPECREIEPPSNAASTSSQTSKPTTKKRKINRKSFTPHQVLRLESVFQTDPSVSKHRRMELAAELDLEYKRVKIWFQNRRVKQRKDSLKKNCNLEINTRPNCPEQMQEEDNCVGLPVIGNLYSNFAVVRQYPVVSQNSCIWNSSSY